MSAARPQSRAQRTVHDDAAKAARVVQEVDHLALQIRLGADDLDAERLADLGELLLDLRECRRAVPAREWGSSSASKYPSQLGLQAARRIVPHRNVAPEPGQRSRPPTLDAGPTRKPTSSSPCSRTHCFGSRSPKRLWFGPERSRNVFESLGLFLPSAGSTFDRRVTPDASCRRAC